MSTLTGVEIAAISYNSSTKQLKLDTVISFDGYSAGDKFIGQNGWRYNYGDSQFVNFVWNEYEFSSTISVTGKATYTQIVYLNVAFLACGATFEFTVKMGGKSGNATVFIPADFTIPSANHRIDEYPTIHNQYVYYDEKYCGKAGNCVAQAVATAKEIHELRSGKSDCDYSVGYLYGATADYEDYTQYAKAFDFVRDTGIPPYRCYQDHVFRYPDNRFLADYKLGTVTVPGARAFFRKHTNPNYIRPQKIAGWSVLADSVSNWNWNSIFAAIQDSAGSSSSVVVAALGIDKAFDDAETGGYMGDILGGARDGHMVVILGWKTHNDRRYWIAQNSWGRDYGDNGIVYIPFTNNWGADNGTIVGLYAFYRLVDDGAAPAYPSRPSNWAWTSKVAQGQSVTVTNGKAKYLTAEEWNGFGSKINAYREYMALPGHDFAKVVSGDPMLATQANEVRSAIAEMSPPVSAPSAVSKDNKIAAAFVSGLSNALNSIT